MTKEIYLNQSNAIFIIIFLSLLFLIIGILYSKKYKGIENYLLANRSVGTLSLTTSLVASALGTWILFGPASAATWGGIGAVIGYALGTATPMFFLLNFGPKIRKEFPTGLTLTQFIKTETAVTSAIKKTVIYKTDKIKINLYKLFPYFNLTISINVLQLG